jgi:general secretion pathway protein G
MLGKVLKKNRGFTLVELMVTIAIIGVLAGLSTYSLVSTREKAKEAVALNDIAQIKKSIEMLGNDTGLWPGHQSLNMVCTDLAGGCPEGNEICGVDENGDDCSYGLRDGFSGIIENDSLNAFPAWNGPYMNKIPLDPWGHEYFFDTDYEVTVDNEPCNGGASCLNAVVVGSYGPNGEGNNSYDGDDIITIMLR